MKISNIMEQERISSQHNRKKILQRKEAGDAYRKNAMYFQPKKNPLLIELENLLLGRTDQDLYDQQQEESKEVTPQQKAIMEGLQQTEKNVRAHEQSYKVGMNDNADLSHISDSELGNTMHILEQVRNAALSSAEPSTQDLRVAQSIDAQIQHMLNNSNFDEVATNESEPSFVRDIIEVKVPERYSKELKLDPFADTIFGKNYETAFKLRAFKQVSERYAAHVQMAKNGYRPDKDSMFSLIA
ncbi:hypothetical protein M5J14_08780 [Lysinibacillus sp. OL1_EC]|uniref:hypothetical protein n=1 Tax=Lysinibacillus sp. OL1_EC TaxID=2943493 RepID=UPI001040C2B5|nr:hypothetical protein [Lysinibacillus sp. OL1_EC]MCM0624621.1 hypothetical protein [Lysinibacillus sp. OL1_EC]TBV87958.1 hypothetical protein EW028_09680 [Lysinibacillus sp. OL1]